MHKDARHTPQPRDNEQETSSSAADADIEEYCNAAIHPVTREHITNYMKLKKDPATTDVWCRAFGKEFGGLAKGDDLTGEKGTNTVVVMTHEEIAKILHEKVVLYARVVSDYEEIAKIPHKKVVTYVRVVPDYRPQKDDPYRIRITAGGNLIKRNMELTTRTADMLTAKLMWNSVISTPGAQYAGMDIKNFYLGTRMD